VIAFAIVLTVLAAIVTPCWIMWDEIRKVVASLRKHHDRISKLEVHETKQDGMLISHDAEIDRQHAQLTMARRDIKELGKDVGWGDDDTKTLVSKKPPDDAA
jgi:hypothetical protein